MSDLRIDGPVTILVLLGITLPSISESELSRIRDAAPPGSTVRVANGLREAIALAADAEIILGFIPEPLFSAAPRLRWVHAIASGMDMFLYPAMRDSSVVLSGEKGLVGGHLADTAFGLLLALTREIATSIRLGPEAWKAREEMRRRELELEGLTLGVVGFGGTGRALARRAVAFGMRVLATRRTDGETPSYVERVGRPEETNELLAEAGCRDIAAYNELPWDELRERLHVETPEEEAKIPRSLPYMVFVIDELADLMMTNKEVEGSIIRIAQKARAVGIHLILATQRPQANVVTGLIKSNMPCRVCFKVASGMDSRIVMDHKGGELLLGMGDMLVLTPSTHKIARAQGTLVDDAEIRKVVRFLRDNAGQQFERSLLSIRTGDPDEDRLLASENNSSASLAAAQEDPLFERAVEIVLETKRGSVSLLQRRLAIGYTRASRLIDLMGIAGIIGEHKGSVARDVAITPEMWDAMKRQAAADAEAAGEPSLFSASPAPAQPPAPASVPAPLTDIDDAPPFDADNEAAIEVHAVDRDLTFVADGDDDADYGHDEFDEPDDTR